MPRPSLLGALVGKAVAVAVDDEPDAQRIHLALLLSLVDDPLSMADGMVIGWADPENMRRHLPPAG